jgi:Fe-S-cluster-containing dehydrogenase component
MNGMAQFVFDPNRCTGCEACVMACRLENRPAQTQPWRRVRTFNGLRLPGVPVLHFSLACHHCADPACLANCPAGAYSQDPATGAVSHHADRCMGCRYCTWACPHDAPRFDPVQGTVEKCTFCLGRQQQGLQPACVARCPMEALGTEPRDRARRVNLTLGSPSSRLGPALRVLAGVRPAPRLTAAPEAGALARGWRALLTVPEPRITARGEWALVAFTSTLTVLVAVCAAVAAGTGGIVPRPLPHPWLGLWPGALALSLSAWHLGRPERGWRALRNLRRSWLSREVALVMAFLALAGLGLIGFPQDRALAWAAVAVGFAALFAVDRVYQVAIQAGPGNFHSAHTLFNGLYLTGLLCSAWPLALAAGGLKAALYLNRKAHFRRQGRGVRPWLSALRLALGFALPALAFGGAWAVLGAILGDLADRWEYYGELAIPTPELALGEELKAMAKF